MRKMFAICMLLATVFLLAVLVFQFLEMKALFIL
jgi:hypothetical protein